MHTFCELSKEAFESNYLTLKGFLEPSKLAPVLKSNAYGHGLKESYEALASFCPEIICVNYLFEAKLLRALGFKGGLLVVGPVFPEEFEEALFLDAEVTIGGEKVWKAWLKSEKKSKVHLKFDTGLSRQGLSVEKAADYAKDLIPFKENLKGISTHFANVEDVTSQSYAERQLLAFEKVDRTFKSLDFSYERHVSASAPGLLLEKARFDFCRVGISLYGFWPSSLTRVSFLSQKSKLIELKPVLSWKTKIASVRSIKAGTAVSYGCTFTASSDMKVAVLPIGYYEGYPRAASNRGAYVLCQGKRCQILGRICMNMMVIDVSHLEKPSSGESVTLIGRDGRELIRAEDLAGWADTIQYEIVTRIHPELPRKLLS